MIRRPRSFGSKGRLVVGLSLLASTSACSMFHSNIRGGFACAAPDGSCAPTTVIDDAALKSITDNPVSGDLALPAPAASERGGEAEQLVPGTRVAKEPQLAASLSGRALRIVFPAHKAPGGPQVPKRIAYARVDLAEWEGFANEPTFSSDGKIKTKVSRGLLGAAVNAPEMLSVGTAANQPIEQVASSSARPAPTAAATSSSPASAGWIDDVKAQAAKVLSEAKNKSAGTFSPSEK